MVSLQSRDRRFGSELMLTTARPTAKGENTPWLSLATQFRSGCDAPYLHVLGVSSLAVKWSARSLLMAVLESE